MDLLLKNIGVLATPTGTAAKKGAAQGGITLLNHAVVGVLDGKVAYVGPDHNAPRGAREIDCGGRLVTPGLVDCHTHLVFGGWRQKELAMKLDGVPYLDILKAGGGILSTVEHTRAATGEELFHKSMGLLEEMLRHGTTAAEAKSGYGLTLADERKQLQVIRRLQEFSPVDIVPTFLGAHAVPREYRDDREAFVDLVIGEMLPAIAAEGLAEYCDVFCETAVFTPDDSRRILKRAAELGMGLKAHVDEIDPIGGAELAAELGCVSAEHLVQASDAGIAAMAERGVIAALLPATSFYLDKPYARARAMVERGVAVAVSSDFNPGSSPSLNLQFAMNLACLKYRLTPAETLTAATLNGAAAIGRAETLGSVEPGKQADLVVWDAPDLETIFYRYGSNLVNTVVKRGEPVTVSVRGLA